MSRSRIARLAWPNDSLGSSMSGAPRCLPTPANPPMCLCPRLPSRSTRSSLPVGGQGSVVCGWLAGAPPAHLTPGRGGRWEVGGMQTPPCPADRRRHAGAAHEGRAPVRPARHRQDPGGSRGGGRGEPAVSQWARPWWHQALVRWRPGSVLTPRRAPAPRHHSRGPLAVRRRFPGHLALCRGQQVVRRQREAHQVGARGVRPMGRQAQRAAGTAWCRHSGRPHVHPSPAAPPPGRPHLTSPSLAPARPARPPQCALTRRAAFSLAAKLSPCVIFIDEVDALLGRRNSSREHEALRCARRRACLAWWPRAAGACLRAGGPASRSLCANPALLIARRRLFLAPLPGSQPPAGR